MTDASLRIRQAAIRLFAEKDGVALSVSELAQAAGLARGTVYNNLEHPEALFGSLASELARELTEEAAALTRAVDDAAERVAIGLRVVIKRAHDDPQIGRFLVRYGFTTPSLQVLWQRAPLADVLLGIEQGRFSITRERAPAAVAMIAGSVLSAIFLVTEGHSAWREAATDAAAFALRGLGITAKEAQRLAAIEPRIAAPERLPGRARKKPRRAHA